MRTRSLVPLGAAGLLAALFCTADAARAQTTLRYKFEAGDKLTYDQTQKIKMTMNAAKSRAEKICGRT